MIFAEIRYNQHYSDIHDSLVDLLKSNFNKVESGHQGDRWIWIFEGDEKVAVDTFSSMKHQLKSEASNDQLVRRVINVLGTKYELSVYLEPVFEAHEE